MLDYAHMQCRKSPMIVQSLMQMSIRIKELEQIALVKDMKNAVLREEMQQYTSLNKILIKEKQKLHSQQDALIKKNQELALESTDANIQMVKVAKMMGDLQKQDEKRRSSMKHKNS